MFVLVSNHWEIRSAAAVRRKVAQEVSWKKSAVIVVGWQQQLPVASCLQPHHTRGDIQHNSTIKKSSNTFSG